MALPRMRNRLLLSAVLLAAACTDAPQERAADVREPSRSRSASASPGTSPSTSPLVSSRPSRGASTPGSSPSPAPAVQGLELRGDDLAVTRIGAAKPDAVAAVERQLGPGDADPGAVSCIGGRSEVVWPDLRLSFDGDDRLNGWVVGTSRLATPSGVRVGTTVAELKRIYGDRLRISPPNPDHGWTYTLSGVNMVGSLDGSSDDSRVTSLANGACTGP